MASVSSVLCLRISTKYSIVISSLTNFPHFTSFTDCSGCMNGGYRCSSDCFYYDCDQSNCDFLDEESFCNGESDRNWLNEVCSMGTTALVTSTSATSSTTTTNSSAGSANASQETVTGSTSTTESSSLAESANAN